MYCWYLRHTYLQDELEAAGQADGLRREGRPRRSIEAPVFIYGSREDHIVPWKAAYASTRSA